MSFGKNKAQLVSEGDTGIKFADVAGTDEAKEELEEIDVQMSQFIDYFAGDAGKDEVLILRSLPGGILLTSVRGEEMPPIADSTLASVVWRFWLAEGSIVDRDDLIKHAVSEED